MVYGHANQRNFTFPIYTKQEMYIALRMTVLYKSWKFMGLETLFVAIFLLESQF